MQNKIFLQHKFNCSPTTLFDWLTQPKLISKWFGPKSIKITSVQADVSVSGYYRIKLKKPDNECFYIEGKYLEIIKPSKLVFTFRYQGLPKKPPPSIVTIKLEALNASTTLLYLSQEFNQAPLDLENRTQAWNHMINKLSLEVSTGALL